jgi:protoporphyrinogen oxidase
VPVDYHWVYVPEPRYPFFRVGVFSNAVDAMAPRGRASLYVELTDRTGPVKLPEIARALRDIGAISEPEDVLFADLREVEHAYVVFDDAHGPATRQIHRWLAELGVRSCGRYGAWTYNSMEDSMVQGIEAAAWAREQLRARYGWRAREEAR